MQDQEMTKLLQLSSSTLVFFTPILPGHIAQSVMCLTADTCPTADQGVMSLMPAQKHTFGEINHEIISTVILLPFC